MYAFQLNSLIKNPNVHLLPGITDDTIETCSRLLQLNHEKYHIFFFIKGGFHNHTAHHLLAGLGLGASSQTLERIYENQQKIQVPLQPLHDKNDFDAEKCLGDDNYYHDYVEYFTKELDNEKYRGNIEEFIEDYLFNKDYLSLIFKGAIHAFIHLGYALEFQSKVMAIEGLAMAAIDRYSLTDVFKHLKQDENDNGDKTALEIIDLIEKDQRFSDENIFSKADDFTNAFKFFEQGGDSIVAEYAQMWKVDLNDLRRFDILAHFAAIRPKKAIRLNFFLMHLTTSSLFLNIFTQSFKSKENQSKFLRYKFTTSLVYYIAFGRPKLNIDYLINEYQPSKEHLYLNAQNPWLPLIDKCLTHPDEHVIKTIRALIYAERHDNAEKKDRLPYLKMAQMVMDTLFPVEGKSWTQEIVGYDQFWETVEDLE